MSSERRIRRFWDVAEVVVGIAMFAAAFAVDALTDVDTPSVVYLLLGLYAVLIAVERRQRRG